MANRFLLGHAVKLSTVGFDQKAVAQIRVKRNQLDKHLNMFFSKDSDYWAYDRQRQTKLGDAVLIKELAEPLSLTVSHQIDRIVFQHGNIVDPITKRRVSAPEGDIFDDTEAKKLQWIKDLMQQENQIVNSSADTKQSFPDKVKS